MKFFGQKNYLSNEKDIQTIKKLFIKQKYLLIIFLYFSDMDKKRNWLIDIYLSLGYSLCDLSIINDEQTNYLNNIIKILQKHIDINDTKLNNFIYKYNLFKKSYGKIWKLLLKQIEEKSSLQQQEYDQKLLQVFFFFFFFQNIYFKNLALSNNEYEIFNRISRTINGCQISSNLCPLLALLFFSY